jgi:hypothetical protein
MRNKLAISVSWLSELSAVCNLLCIVLLSCYSFSIFLYPKPHFTIYALFILATEMSNSR